jgi:hypothetical protein
MTFGSPWWLAGLLLVPVIRWLHRGGALHRRLTVAALAPWKNAAPPAAATERATRPPDPAWRRRALVAALLCLALAAPRWWHEARPVTIWVDDSLSMLAREAGSTRLQVGLERVRSALAEGSRTDAELRALSRPWRALQADEAASLLEAHAGQREPAPPPAGLVTSTREHWLLTDGTDATLDALAAQGAFARVVRVGEPTSNVGVVRLAARRDAGDSFTVEVEVRNGGTGVQQRTVELRAGTATGEVLARWNLSLDPGAATVLRKEIPARARVLAVLAPADTLEADDRLELDGSALARLATAVDTSCPRGVAAAARAHPALAVGSDAPPALVVDCGRGAGQPGVPRLRFLRNVVAAAVGGDWRWSSDASPLQRSRLDGLDLRRVGRLDIVNAHDQALLTTPDGPLIVRRLGADGTVTIETVLDPDGATDAVRPAGPMLFAVMVDAALGAAALDAAAVAQRDAHAVDVLPRDAVAGPATVTGPQRQPREVGHVLLVIAALLLALEVALMVRLWVRDHADARAVRT